MKDHLTLAPRAQLILSLLGASWGLLGVAAPRSGAGVPALLLAAVALGLGLGAASAERWGRPAAQVAASALTSAALLFLGGPASVVLAAVALLAGLGAAGALAGLSRSRHGGGATELRLGVWGALAAPSPARMAAALGSAAALGASASTLLAGEVLAPALGELALSRGAALLAAIAGVVALLGPWPAPAPAERGAAPRSTLATALLLGAAGWLLWRGAALLLAVALEGSAYAGPLTASAALAGLALGSRWRRLPVEALLGALVAAVGLSLFAVSRAPALVAGLGALLRHAPEAWGPSQLASLAICGAVVALPASFLAAAAWAAHAEWPRGAAGPTVALGAAGGAGLAAALVPRVGPHGLLFFGGALSVAALGVALLRQGRGQRALVVASLAGALTLVTAALAVDFGAPTAFADGHRLVTVSAEAGRRVLRVNGQEIGADGAALDWQVLAPALGVLGRAQAPRRALLLGAGTGAMAHALLSFPLERLEVVTASPALRDAAAAFSDDGRAAFADPRCHVTVAEVGRFLAGTSEVYDVVVAAADPERGVELEVLRLARTRLAPDGRLVQVLTTADSNDHLARLAMRTVRAAFPHATTWLGPDTWALVASTQPQRWDPEALRAQFALPAVAAELARVGVHQPTTVLLRQAQSDLGQAEYAGEGAANLADRDLLAFGAPVAAWVGAGATVPDERTGPSRGRALELARWLEVAPLTPAQFRDALGHLERVQPPDDPLLRALAEAWHAQAPSADAALSLAKAALAQGSPSVARRALAPLVAAGERRPEVVAQWLVLRWAELRRQGTPWSPEEVSDAVALGRAVLAANPGDAELRAALVRLEAAQ